jgi:uncharacterized protein
MKIFMTGATGFVGRATVLRLRRSGHQVVAWVRNPSKARGVLGSEAELLHTESTDAELQACISGCDAVINLAGEPVAGKRWSTAYKDRLVKSRTKLTKRIVDAIAASPTKPKVLVSASAVGFYGNRGDDVLTESSDQGDGFLATLCEQWETAALEAQKHDVRTAILRIGVILGHGGGALTKMLPVFQAGLGGALGKGNQYMPWVHLHDVIEAICFMLENEDAKGIYNLTAPSPSTSREFGTTLAAVLKRPSFMPAPAFAIKMLLGEAATIVLNSQRVMPKHLLDDGFEFEYRELDEALRAAIIDSETQIQTLEQKSPQPCAPQSQYLQKRRPRYLLNTRIVLNAPVDEVFAFFSRPENLGAITPPDLSFNILDEIDDIQEGTIIHYAINMGALPMKWQTQIAQWKPQIRFVDSQTKGPYTSWWHEHHFLPDGERTIMEDRVYYTPPFGLLGQLVNHIFIASKLRHIFKFRYGAMEMRFGTTNTRT